MKEYLADGGITNSRQLQDFAAIDSGTQNDSESSMCFSHFPLMEKSHSGCFLAFSIQMDFQNDTLKKHTQGVAIHSSTLGCHDGFIGKGRGTTHSLTILDEPLGPRINTMLDSRVIVVHYDWNVWNVWKCCLSIW